MKRILSVVLAACLLLSCAVLFSACGEKKTDNYPVTVNGVEIAEEPSRVVVLNDAFADIILYMGYETKLIGRSFECDQLPLNVLTSVGSGASPSMDTLLSLNPDLVIADSSLNEKSRSKLNEQGVKVITFDPPATQEEIKQLYIDLGTVLGGKTDGAEKGEESYEKLFDLLKQYSTTTKDIVVTDAYLYLDEMGNYCTFTKGTVEQMLFNYNGAMNVFSSKESPIFHATESTDESGNVTVADEMYIRYASPTFLFLDGETLKDGTIQSAVYEKLLNDPNLNHLAALREGRVCFIPRKNFYRPGITFEETLFTMIDALNKDEEASEEASAHPTEAPTLEPTEEETEAETEEASDEEETEEAPADEGPVEDAYDPNADNGVYY